MQIIVPMSGEGARFKRAGYTEIKPLIRVEGKAIIEHVINLFPGEENFIFICREEHLKQTNLRDVLLSLKPSSKIVSMPGEKLGPVYAVTKAFDFIREDEPAIVNYCDFNMNWDYGDFKRTVMAKNYDACLPVYTGFHPHLMHENNFYASIKTNQEGWLEEIKEKFSYTADKTLSMHSPGTHYFKRGEYVKRFFQQIIDEKIDLNGEYYVSLVFNLLVRAGLKVGIYDKISHFCQWGTPEDLEEYLVWSDLFSQYNVEVKFEEIYDALIDSQNDYILKHSKDNLKKSFEYWKSFFKNL